MKHLAIVVAAGLALCASQANAQTQYDPVDQVYRWLYPQQIPKHVPFPTKQKEEFPRPSAPQPTTAPPVVTAPTPTPPVAEPEPTKPKKKRFTVAKNKTETFKRTQRKPTADECAKMRNAGRQVVIFMAPKRFTRAQVEQALRDCGL